MTLKTLATILLVVSVIGEESRGHGRESRVRGEEEGHLHGVEARAQKRMIHKKGDHLFNNIAKGFTNMIQDVFTETRLKSFCKASTSGNNLEITDKLNNMEVTNEFPTMVTAFQEYKMDQVLTKSRDKLTVFGQEHQGADKNAEQWKKTLENLRKMTFDFIDKFIETYSPQKPEKYENRKKMDNIRNRIDQIINKKEYVDQEAKEKFLENIKKNMKNMKNMAVLVNNVEQRTEEAIEELPAQINRWAVEAAKFYKRKTSRR